VLIGSLHPIAMSCDESSFIPRVNVGTAWQKELALRQIKVLVYDRFLKPVRALIVQWPSLNRSLRLMQQVSMWRDFTHDRNSLQEE
jgi:hypothetical protein